MFRGVAPAQIAAGVRAAYASHRWPTMAAGGMAYMLSPRQWLTPEGQNWKPHLMFFLPSARAAAAWGAVQAMDASVIDAGTYPFASATGGFVLIPVEQWSDGSPYLPGGDSAQQH
jgi:hypothetical protein